MKDLDLNTLLEVFKRLRKLGHEEAANEVANMYFYFQDTEGESYQDDPVLEYVLKLAKKGKQKTDIIKIVSQVFGMPLKEAEKVADKAYQQMAAEHGIYQ